MYWNKPSKQKGVNLEGIGGWAFVLNPDSTSCVVSKPQRPKRAGDASSHAALFGLMKNKHRSNNRKNWRLEKIGDSGTKSVILKYCRCTTYCKYLATTGEITGIITVWWTRPPLILQIHSLHQIATGTPFHVPPRPWINYHHFPSS